MTTAKVTLMSVATLALLAGAASAGAADGAKRSVGTVIDDAAITASVKTKLIGDKDTKARQINVETSKGVVQLNGYVDSSAARTEAEKIAAATDGVMKVSNNLQVRTAERSAGEVVDDVAITAKVDAALAADSRTSALGIDVASRDGEVRLSGFAKSSTEKMAAAEVAARVKGVRKVSNDLAIR